MDFAPAPLGIPAELPGFIYPAVSSYHEALAKAGAFPLVPNTGC